MSECQSPAPSIYFVSFLFLVIPFSSFCFIARDCTETHDVLFHPSLHLPLVALIVSPCFSSCHVFFVSFVCSALIYCGILFSNCGLMYSLDLCGHVDVLYDVVYLISTISKSAVSSSCRIMTCDTLPRCSGWMGWAQHLGEDAKLQNHSPVHSLTTSQPSHAKK